MGYQIILVTYQYLNSFYLSHNNNKIILKLNDDLNTYTLQNGL